MIIILKTITTKKAIMQAIIRLKENSKKTIKII